MLKVPNLAAYYRLFMNIYFNVEGAALIAYQLYSRLAHWANKGYEEELKTYLQNCAGYVNS